jgi:hypothetical protein
MQWFIDDLHLPLITPASSKPNLCSSHEYLRQLIDIKGLYNLEKKNEWSVIEDLVIFASLTSDSDALVEPRLRSHLATINVPDLQGYNLSVVATQQLTALLQNAVSEATLKTIVEYSIKVYRSVKRSLSESHMPGRQHYCFSLKYLESVFQVSFYVSIHHSEQYHTDIVITYDNHFWWLLGQTPANGITISCCSPVGSMPVC